MEDNTAGGIASITYCGGHMILQGFTSVSVQATAFMEPYWTEARLNCIEPLLRGLDKGDSGPYEVSIVTFRSPAPFSAVPVEVMPWTSDLAKVRQTLDSLVLDGGGMYDISLVGTCFAGGHLNVFWRHSHSKH